MRIDVAPDNAVTGTFYGSATAAGQADASEGRACFAFTTRDGSGPYQTSGCPAGGRAASPARQLQRAPAGRA